MASTANPSWLSARSVIGLPLNVTLVMLVDAASEAVTMSTRFVPATAVKLVIVFVAEACAAAPMGETCALRRVTFPMRRMKLTQRKKKHESSCRYQALSVDVVCHCYSFVLDHNYLAMDSYRCYGKEQSIGIYHISMIVQLYKPVHPSYSTCMLEPGSIYFFHCLCCARSFVLSHSFKETELCLAAF